MTTGNGKIRILLVDDHKLLRDGIASMLHPVEDFEIVGSVSSGEEAITNLPATTTEYGRATIPAAKAFLARMYLTRGMNAQAIAMSKDPFDVYFGKMVKEIHGVDISQPPPGPPPEKVFDYHG